jgi:hypothetical protein
MSKAECIGPPHDPVFRGPMGGRGGFFRFDR